MAPHNADGGDRAPTHHVAWNVGPGRRPRELGRALRDLIEARDDEVALFEVRPWVVPILRLRFGRRWRIYRRRSDVTLLIRRSLPKRHVQAIGHDVPWIGPGMGRRKRGRKHLVVTDDDSRRIYVHRVPGGPSGGIVTHGANRRAWQADLALIAEAVDFPGPVSVLGDHNATVEELAREYEPLGLTVVATNTKVDHGAHRGHPGMTGRRLPKDGPSHPPIRWRIP